MSMVISTILSVDVNIDEISFYAILKKKIFFLIIHEFIVFEYIVGGFRRSIAYF